MIIEVTKADGVKCPRCWNYHTVRGNYRDLCDRCQVQCLEGVSDWVARGQLTKDEAEQLVRGIRASVNQWSM